MTADPVRKGSTSGYLGCAASTAALLASVDVGFVLLRQSEAGDGSFLGTVAGWVLLTGIGVAILAAVLHVAGRSRLRTPLLLSAACFLVLTVIAHHFRGFDRGLLLKLGVPVGSAVVSFLFFGLLRRRGPGLERRRLLLSAGFIPALVLLLLPTGGQPIEAPVESEGATRLSVLVLLVDTVRADHCSHHGYERPTTPNLGRFAERGLVFRRAHAVAPWTKPSVASILTGLPPSIHGADGWLDALPRGATSLAESFDAAGYDTGLFSDNVYISRKFGFEQGFGTVWDLDGSNRLERMGIPSSTFLGSLVRVVAKDRVPNPRATAGDWDRAVGAPTLNRRFLEWLDDSDGERPFFAFLHYLEPHAPYAPPPPFDTMFRADGSPCGEQVVPGAAGFAPFEAGAVLSDDERRALVDAYDGEIAYWDHEFGRLVSELSERGVLDDTVVVVVSDHGEGFGAHGTWDHANSLYEELLHVPLVIRVPGAAPGVCTHSVSLLDLPATILQAAGFSQPSAHAGRSFLAPIPRGDRRWRAELDLDGHLSLTECTERRKWILSRSSDRALLQLFDLDRDPGESRDLAPGREEEGAEVGRRLARRKQAEEARRIGGDEVELTPELQKELRGLGYLK